MDRSQLREPGRAWGLPAAYLGPGLMIVAMLCFVLMDAILKHLVVRYDGILLSWVRCLMQVLLVGAIVPFIGGARAIESRRPGLQVGRGLCLALTSVVMTIASQWMPLTEIYVIAFGAPLIASIIAALTLGERPTGLQWLLIVAGFAGVAIALNPTAPTATLLLLLLPLIQAFGNAVYHVLTRICARTDGPVAQLFHPALSATLLLALVLPWVFVPLRAADWMLLAFGGALVTFGHYLLIKAFAMAPTARVSPMVYFQIVWSTLIGYLAFGDVPSSATLIGGAIIAVTGVALIRSRG